MARYFLSTHSHVCIRDDYAVFLDLRQDKYTALEPADARTLSGVVQGWPAGIDRSAEAQRLTGDRDEVIRLLLGERLLTDDAGSGKAATPVSLERATASLLVAPRQLPRVDRRHFGNFVAAWLSATTILRALPLRIGVERARRRKAHRLAGAGEFDSRKAYGLMMAYFILRPNFFSVVDACLRDSMTVIEFLARYDMYPKWVFGVTMNPFTAHSWVQAGSIVVNDSVDHVNRFTPILAI